MEGPHIDKWVNLIFNDTDSNELTAEEEAQARVLLETEEGRKACKYFVNHYFLMSSPIRTRLLQMMKQRSG